VTLIDEWREHAIEIAVLHDIEISSRPWQQDS